MAKVDFHCHSFYSDQPIHWLFRKLGGRESYTTVEDLYTRLKSMGMDFVTVTDHDRIEGAVELADRYDDCFISCEFSVYFYRQPAYVHICAYDITEKQYQMGRKLSNDIIQFAEYFREHEVLITVPHPMHCNRGKLDLNHFEQLLILFDYFEERNGLMPLESNNLATEFLDNLRPEFMEKIIKKHGLEPHSSEPWKKGRVGGSDDHFYYYLGRAWTEVENVATYKDFLQGIKDKRSKACGGSMTALGFAHATQTNWINGLMHHYCKPGSFDERLANLVSRLHPVERSIPGGKTLSRSSRETRSIIPGVTAMKRFALERALRVKMILLLRKQKRFLAKQADNDCGCPSMGAPAFLSPAELAGFKKEFQTLLKDWKDSGLFYDQQKDHTLHQKTHDFASAAFNGMYRYSIGQFLCFLQTGNIQEAFARLSLAIPGTMLAVPYIMGYKHFYYDNKYLHDLASHYSLKSICTHKPEKWGWFTDTLLDINGAAGIIRKYTKMAEEGTVPITAITCHPDKNDFPGNFKIFEPLFHFPLPEYELMTLAIPPLLDVLHHCEQEGYTRLIISSPGPVGLLGLLIAEVLSIPTSGIYHTDIPAYAGKLTNDPGLEEIAWKCIALFYGRMERVFVLSDSYKKKLVARGIDEEKIRTFIKGIDTDFFRPGRNADSVRKKWNLQGKTVLLFVGRISKEKDLEILVESYLVIRKKHPDAALALVGDGPFLKELQKEYGARDDIILPGFIEGEELADWYNCADIFTFPSTTDTYGTVLLEAQASGLPAVVSDQGGPKEVIVDGETGIVTRGGNAGSFTAGILRLLDDAELRSTMADRARSHVENKSWQNAFASFVMENSKH